MKHKYVIAVLLLLIGIGCYCGYRYYKGNVLPEKLIDDSHDEQIKLFERVKPAVTGNPDAGTEKSPEIKEDPLQLAEEVNRGVVGWITIDSTNIDFPIAQAEDNDFYLHNGFDGKNNNELGCPFLDCRCEGDFSGFNSIVYGHHITRRRMFADVALFNDISFMQSHPTGTLTMKDGAHNVRFFAYMTVMDTAPAYHAVFVSDTEKNEYIDYIFSDAQYTTVFSADELKEKDDLHLLLLSTCTYEFTDARGILIGVIE